MAEHTTGALARVFAGARRIALAKARWRTRPKPEAQTVAPKTTPPSITETSSWSDLSSESCAALAREFQAHAVAVRDQLLQYAALLADGDADLQKVLEQVALEQPWPSN